MRLDNEKSTFIRFKRCGYCGKRICFCRLRRRLFIRYFDLNEQIQELKNKSDKIAELESKFDELEAENSSQQAEIDKFKNQNDLFTGSPKFNYSLSETIPYYISGTKVFDFKITKFTYSPAPDNALVFEYTVTPIKSLNVQSKEAFSAIVYDASTNTIVSPYTNSNNSMAFSIKSAGQKTITLFYFGSPFASITATPTTI